ncbi:unnamed protein product [Chilo suppressalis]|uniref:DUF4817 domain-containing protein n=1 Tax=Chilo suppressalis TaxID=168631 RepID=A0ABN8APD8_CHISP|nr:hypothetical protein evm_009685 [Chilo suppressalis]CAH0397238.1 unnamed protein product [Chilo suppressalis]
MYHYTNQSIYNHEVYQQCSVVETNRNHNVASVVTENGGFNTNNQEIVPFVPQDKRHNAPTEIRDNVIEKSPKKTIVDTSNFSIEERLVTAVWVHERKRTNTGMNQIKQDFRLRFGREPPAKNTLLAWERKLFATGSVRDAPRPGRPVKRGSRVAEVSASVAAAPALSVRGRARALGVPLSTLRAILTRDLRLKHEQPRRTGKPSQTRIIQPARKKSAAGPPANLTVPSLPVPN